MRLMLRCLMVVLLSGSVCQTGAQSALSVRGSVVDPTGAGIPGATVRLETASGDLLTQSQSDAKGEFILLNLPSGNYSLVVPAYSGFGSHTLALRLYSSLTGIKVTLAAQSVNQEIDVAPDESLSTKSSANRDTVSVTGDELRKSGEKESCLRQSVSSSYLSQNGDTEMVRRLDLIPMMRIL